MQNKPDYAQLIAASAETFFVTDKNGNILVVNPAVCMLLDMTEDQLVGANVKNLVEAGYYDRSTTMEAIERKQLFSGIYRTKSGKEIVSTSRPILDDDGNVSVVITNSFDTERVDGFIKMIEEERALTKRYRAEVEYLRHRYIEKDNIVFISKAMENILHKLNTVAKADSTIILFGESGTGKDLLAKYTHKNSLRANGPFIDVNCAAIPEHLMESELFGYEKGAFTGASKQGKVGLMELADKGTLFLDEIGELPLHLQAKLLRVLESHEIRRIGSVTGRKTDFRLITATNRELKKMVEENRFRDDLYYRLNVIPIQIPPLRNRLEDIIVLAEHFLSLFNTKYGYGQTFTRQTMDALLQYQWPGNARELRNVVERLVITGSCPETELALINGNIITPSLKEGAGEEGGRQHKSEKLSENVLQINLCDHNITLKEVVAEAEKQYILKVLDQCEGNVRKAAEKIGIHKTILYRKLRRIRS
ncbi:sigma-54 interaction domain-containing protein [Sporomusa termitida]|uniref:Anaerobic nitric oxide reductase transcription regulator NorR n=1 Tax=Sporomusa termitida TaxID=2377 RepID=A0A517DWT9_9FIRM|nr:sigma 54-interacting transcriptional regulator [Sporomusa termitida]QDR81820.1 Anaerobic nitric oxide reductase transcription regulator NorR [Sporomusa termitida]